MYERSSRHGNRKHVLMGLSLKHWLTLPRKAEKQRLCATSVPLQMPQYSIEACSWSKPKHNTQEIQNEWKTKQLSTTSSQQSAMQAVLQVILNTQSFGPLANAGEQKARKMGSDRLKCRLCCLVVLLEGHTKISRESSKSNLGSMVCHEWRRGAGSYVVSHCFVMKVRHRLLLKACFSELSQWSTWLMTWKRGRKERTNISSTKFYDWQLCKAYTQFIHHDIIKREISKHKHTQHLPTDVMSLICVMSLKAYFLYDSWGMSSLPEKKKRRDSEAWW